MKKIILWSVITILTLSYGEAFALVQVSGTVTYAGPKTGTIYIEAFAGSGCGQMGVPGYATIPNPGPYTMNIPTGTYYICAYRDVNGNGMKDNGEPQGAYQNNPIILSTDGDSVSDIDVTIFDPQGIPTMNEWGMIIFMALAGIGSAYYLRRQRRKED